MKRALSLILAALILMPSALAEVDLTGMSYEDLLKLREQVSLEIWTRAETKAVTVPVGVWEIGKDIPVGHWSITAEAGHRYDWARIDYCDLLDETGKWVSPDCRFHYSCIVKCADSESNISELTTVDLDLKEGAFIIIEASPVVFTVFTGKPDLGFDW